MPVSPEQIAELIESPLRNEVPRWDDLPADPVARVSLLRKTHPPEAVTVLLELSELRHRARTKFRLADRMFFDREALEQSTGEEIASWRSEAFRECESVADLTCAIGGDAIQIARYCRILASDVSAARVAMAKANAEVYGVDRNFMAAVAAAEDFPEVDAYFLDPSRRSGGRRSRHLAGLSPSLDLLMRLLEASGRVGVKLSPATPDVELNRLGARLEFISEGGVCKEAMAWFGDLHLHDRSATILPSRITLPCRDNTPVPDVSEPLEYLLEPDPAIVRAGLIPELCEDISTAVLDPQVGYLTGHSPVESPCAVCYRVLASMPFSTKNIRGSLRELGIGRVEVKKRASAVDVDALRRTLQSDLPGRGTVVVTRIGTKPVAIICERMG